MPSLDQEYSAFSIDDLSIIFSVGEGEQQSFSIRGIMEKIEITENIISPVITGSVVVADTNVIARILKTGSTFLSFKMSKDEENFVYEKTMRIYKQEKRKLSTQTSEKFILYFCSEEMILSEQSKISRGYTETYSKIAENILIDFLGVSSENMTISESIGVKKIAIPTLRPFDALFYCANRAVNTKNIPDFLFFENKEGFNFVSLETLYSEPAFSIFFTAKNTVVDEEGKQSFFGAKHSEVSSQFNLLDSIKKGTYSSTILGFDLITRTLFRQQVNNSYYDKKAKLNTETNLPTISNKKGVLASEAYDSKVMTLVTDSQYRRSQYAMKKDPTAKLHDPEISLAHRNSVFSFISAKRMKILLPGNFDLTVGMIVDLKYPKRGKIDNTEELDNSFSGKQLVIAVRHIIIPSKHETIIEVASDSDMSADET